MIITSSYTTLFKPLVFQVCQLLMTLRLFQLMQCCFELLMSTKILVIAHVLFATEILSPFPEHDYEIDVHACTCNLQSVAYLGVVKSNSAYNQSGSLQCSIK